MSHCARRLTVTNTPLIKFISLPELPIAPASRAAGVGEKQQGFLGCTTPQSSIGRNLACGSLCRIGPSFFAWTPPKLIRGGGGEGTELYVYVLYD
jgi:hypothetical protein